MERDRERESKRERKREDRGEGTTQGGSWRGTQSELLPGRLDSKATDDQSLRHEQ